MPDVFRDVAAFLRHQYSLSYSPTAGAKDGKFHKVKVELVAPDGGPLSIVDQKGKKQKISGLRPRRLSGRPKAASVTETSFQLLAVSF